MKKLTSHSNVLNTKAARVSALLTVGLAVLGPGMKLPKAWADAVTVGSVGSVGDVLWSNTVDWSHSGAEFDIMSPSFEVPVTAGLSLTVSAASGTMERRDQGSGWMGCMDSGEALLWLHEDTYSVAEPILVSFSNPVFAVGSKIQNDDYGAYTGLIEAFDIGGNLIGSYSAGANSCFCSNGDAAFLGIQASEAAISFVKFSVPNSSSFAIGELSILAGENQSQNLTQQPAPAPVPEAAPVAAASFFSLLVVRWAMGRKSEKTAATV